MLQICMKTDTTWKPISGVSLVSPTDISLTFTEKFGNIKHKHQRFNDHQKLCYLYTMQTLLMDVIKIISCFLTNIYI